MCRIVYVICERRRGRAQDNGLHQTAARDARLRPEHEALSLRRGRGPDNARTGHSRGALHHHPVRFLFATFTTVTTQVLPFKLLLIFKMCIFTE